MNLKIISAGPGLEPNRLIDARIPGPIPNAAVGFSTNLISSSSIRAGPGGGPGAAAASAARAARLGGPGERHGDSVTLRLEMQCGRDSESENIMNGDRTVSKSTNDHSTCSP
jgi:hypothetical protein